MSVQVTDHLHIGRMSLLQTRWNLKVVGVIGNRSISLDRQGGPEQRHTGTHGAPSRGSST
jgi:hypothetical protein